MLMMLAEAASEAVPTTIGGAMAIYISIHLSTITKQLNSARRSRRIQADNHASLRLGFFGLCRALNHEDVIDIVEREEAERAKARSRD